MPLPPNNFDNPPDLPVFMIWVVDHLIKLSSTVAEVNTRLIEGDQRMQRIEERQERAPKNQHPLTAALAFVREVASPREWAVALALMAGWLKGLINAAEIKAIILAVIGG